MCVFLRVNCEREKVSKGERNRIREGGREDCVYVQIPMLKSDNALKIQDLLRKKRKRRSFGKFFFALPISIAKSLKFSVWHFYKNGPFPASSSLFPSFQYSFEYINFADDWIWTTDLWCRKRPLYQLSHNHCPHGTFAVKNLFWLSLWTCINRHHVYG